MIPKDYFNPDDPGVLRLLSEAEWRGVGITQSLGWEHYEVHGTPDRLLLPSYVLSYPHRLPSVAPEPHVLLFRRQKNFDPHQAAQAQVHNAQAQSKAGAAKNGRKK
jgi:cyclin-dependent kinase regulatory subunit CKS1